MNSKSKSLQIPRAKFIQATLGTLRAAGYLRNRGWTAEAAIVILASTTFKNKRSKP